MKQIPQDYLPILGIKETEKAIELLRDYFQFTFSKKLNLHRVSAPLFVESTTGLNDNLSGTEKAVTFDISAIPNSNCEIVHSLAKWKRMALGKYGYSLGEGIYTNMNAIRRQEVELDNIHSVYVDQWDWEKIISCEDRNLNYLKNTVQDIYSVLYDTACYVERLYPELKHFLPKDISFITSEELLQKYPNMTNSERENAYTKEVGALFLIGIGDKLTDGKPHDMRAPDYDDWSLNGDILIWYPVLDRAVELSSMGIRVDENTLKQQLDKVNLINYTDYHNSIFKRIFPLTIGGGIGQSRLCEVILQKAHIGEVHCSIWDEETMEECFKNNITLL